MNIVGMSNGTSKELPQRQYQAKLRNHLLVEKRKHEESEFDRILQEGLLRKREDGKVEFVNRRI